MSAVAEVDQRIGPRQGSDEIIQSAKRIEGYGVANPIVEVLDRMKIDLLID
jgi:hypothetical protein